jgi:hypothetical protein
MNTEIIHRLERTFGPDEGTWLVHGDFRARLLAWQDKVLLVLGERSSPVTLTAEPDDMAAIKEWLGARDK